MAVEWITHLEMVVTAANARRNPVLLDFTGDR
jgi:hypothetical protein